MPTLLSEQPFGCTNSLPPSSASTLLYSCILLVVLAIPPVITDFALSRPATIPVFLSKAVGYCPRSAAMVYHSPASKLPVADLPEYLMHKEE